MKDSRHSDVSSYSSMLKRGKGGCVSPTTSGSSVGGGPSASDEDEYIRFLETEVFKTELERKKKEEAEHAHKAKLRERLELREAKEREAEEQDNQGKLAAVFPARACFGVVFLRLLWPLLRSFHDLGGKQAPNPRSKHLPLTSASAL